MYKVLITTITTDTTSKVSARSIVVDFETSGDAINAVENAVKNSVPTGAVTVQAVFLNPPILRSPRI